MSKLYTMNFAADQSFPSTPTLVEWFRSMNRLMKSGTDQFTALDVMNDAIVNGKWTTKNVGNDDRMMETWAYYVRQMKSLGLTECGQTGGKKQKLSLEELLGE
jgi:hypothetical protein